MEDFSLNLLCRGRSHLLPLTLDSLKAQEGSFEVILLDQEGTGRLYELVHRYEGLNLRIESALSCHNLGQMMNLGLSCSRGKYIQFLEPGDRYISQYSLSFLTGLIAERESEPGYISARGVLQETRSHWILRKEILELGGFDERLSFRPLLDLLCRLEKKGVQPLLSSRVLIDSPKEGGPLWETGRVLYRHFGWRYTCKWFLKEHFQNIRRALRFVKEAFLGSPD